MNLLLKNGAELEFKDQTPLSCAAEIEHEALVKLLLEKGAELEYNGTNGTNRMAGDCVDNKEIGLCRYWPSRSIQASFSTRC